jgi:hypothetical protein
LSYRRLLTCLFALSLFSLAGCENFDYTVNDKVVYTPRELFHDFDVADEALRNCLTQTIADNAISAASQLTDLNCSNAGIADLDGLAQFSGLLKLRLSSNAVRTSLQELYLDNNRIVDPVPLYKLPALNFVDLSRNLDLQCPASSGLVRVQTVTLPRHCR